MAEKLNNGIRISVGQVNRCVFDQNSSFGTRILLSVLTCEFLETILLKITIYFCQRKLIILK